jgi:hypothetical protein
MDVETQIHGHLLRTRIIGVGRLYRYLKETGFFECPCSTKYHGAYKGGLALHSLRVLYLLFQKNFEFKLNLSYNDIVVTSIGHDVSKVGSYHGETKPYTYNPGHPKGHGMRSVAILKEFITLTPLQIAMIKYHMGMYGATETETNIQEYTIIELKKAFNEYPACKAIYLCDELDTLVDESTH